jgi:hypothetical protein
VDVIAIADPQVQGQPAGAKAFNAIRTAVDAGRISEQRIQESFARVNNLKRRLPN